MINCSHLAATNFYTAESILLRRLAKINALTDPVCVNNFIICQRKDVTAPAVLLLSPHPSLHPRKGTGAEAAENNI